LTESDKYLEKEPKNSNRVKASVLARGFLKTMKEER
jgi:hypothetical protein